MTDEAEPAVPSDRGATRPDPPAVLSGEGATTHDAAAVLSEAGATSPGPTATPAGGAAIAEQRRGQMLQAALEVICERGFADTRIADIADRIGISPALVIYYFKTKDQLLTEAIRYYEDSWYAEGKRRMDELASAARRMEEFVAMNLLPDADMQASNSSQLWLDFWVQAARNPDVAGVRQKSDERWRDVIVSLVAAGQESGEFASIDPQQFAIVLSALLDGLTVQIALGDPVVDPLSAFELCMRYIAEHLGFDWTPGQHAAAADDAGR